MYNFDATGATGHDARKRTIIGSKSISSVTTDTTSSGFDFKAFGSLDSLFRPVSLKGSGGLPRFFHLSGNAATGNFDSSSINQRFFNFLANPSGKDNSLYTMHTGDQQTVGHDIEVVGRWNYAHYTGIASSGIRSHLVSPVNVSGGSYVDDYADDYRFFALRGPLVIHGWGYDTDGKPIPNAADTTKNAESGVFTSSNLQDKFLDNWTQKPQTWPVAPLDIRFNRDRGVWEAGAGGGGSTSRYARLYESLDGWVPQGLTSNPNTYRCLYESKVDGVWTVDTSADYVMAQPAFESEVTLATECDCVCGADTTSSTSSLSIDYPVVTDNFIDNADLNGLIITGAGASVGSSVTVDIFNESTSLGSTPDASVSATVASDGSWTTASLDLRSALGSPSYTEVIAVRVTETDINGIDQSPVYASFTLIDNSSTNTNSSDSSKLPTPSSAPSTTALVVNGRTNIDTPTLGGTTMGEQGDAAGPIISIFDNGKLFMQAPNSAVTAGSTEWTITLDSALSIGTHYLTYTLSDEGGTHSNRSPSIENEGGHSPALVLTVTDQTLGGTITALTEASATFESDDATISVLSDSTFVITNPTTGEDPAKVSSVTMPSPPISGDAGFPINLNWDPDGETWDVVSPVAYFRRVILQTMANDTVPQIVNVSPCAQEGDTSEYLKYYNEVGEAPS